MENLSEIEKDLLLMFVRHHLPMPLRHKIMEALPAAYNKWMGDDILEVRVKPEGAPLAPRL
jgi:hypothetical protein